MEYTILPSKINDIQPTASDIKWEDIIKKSKCKDCMYFRKCKNASKKKAACQEFDKKIENFSV